MTTVDIAWLDKGATDALISDPKIGGKGLNLQNTADFVGGDESTIVMAIVNRTGATLTLEETFLDGGTSVVFEPNGAFDAPPTEMGAGSSSVAIWKISRGGLRNPGVVLKFKAIPETGGAPVYVGGNIIEPAFASRRSGCTVGNGKLGSASDYYSAKFDADSDTDDEKTTSSTSGVASASAFDVEAYAYTGTPAPLVPEGFGMGSTSAPATEFWWMVVAQINSAG